MSVQSLREELVNLPMARALRGHQTFAKKSGLVTATVRAVRDLQGRPDFRPRSLTVIKWLAGAESPVSFEDILAKHGVTVADLENRDPGPPRRVLQPAAQAEPQKPARQHPGSSFMVPPSSLEGESSDATSLVALRSQIAHALLDIASHYANLAATFDAHVTEELTETAPRAASDRHADHSPAGSKRVRR